jgi:hypothetical protein
MNYLSSMDVNYLMAPLENDFDDLRLLKCFSMYLDIMSECLKHMTEAAQCGLSHLKFSRMTFPRLVENVRAFPIFALPDAATVDMEIELSLSSINVSRIGAIIQDRPGWIDSPTHPHLVAYRSGLRPYLSHLFSFVATDDDITRHSNLAMANRLVPCPSFSASDDWDCTCMDPSLLGLYVAEFYKSQPHRFSRLGALTDVHIALEEPGGLRDWLTRYFEERSLLFVHVPVPAHCYHAVYPLFLALRVDYPLPDFRNIIFSTADGSFEHRLELLSKVRCNQIQQQRPVYFILHPETMSE